MQTRRQSGLGRLWASGVRGAEHYLCTGHTENDTEATVRVSILGLGYVGCVSAACLARDGHTVIGVDVNAQKVDLVGSGRSPIIEPHLDELIAEGVRSGRLQ